MVHVCTTGATRRNFNGEAAKIAASERKEVYEKENEKGIIEEEEEEGRKKKKTMRKCKRVCHD